MLKTKTFYLTIFCIMLFLRGACQEWQLPAEEIQTVSTFLAYISHSAISNNGDAFVVWETVSLPSFTSQSFALFYNGTTETWDTIPYAFVDNLGDPVIVNSIGMDAQGNAIALYTYSSNVAVRRYSAFTNTWGPETILTTNRFAEAALSVNAQGDALAVWVARTNPFPSPADPVVESAKYDAGTDSWTNLGVLSGTGAEDCIVTLNDAGNGFCAWGDTDDSRAMKVAYFNGTTWEDTGINAVKLTNSNSFPYQIAMNTQGDVILGYVTSSPITLRACNYDATTDTWTNILGSINTFSQDDYSTKNLVAIDEDGNGFIVYQDTSSNAVANRYNKTTSTWETPTTLFPTAVGSDPKVQIGMDANGNALVIGFSDSTGPTSVLSSYYDATTDTWMYTGVDATVLGTSTNPNSNGLDIAVNSPGNGIAAWSTGTVNADWDMYGAMFKPAGPPPPIPPSPPTSFSGSILKNIAINRVDRIHRLSWGPSPTANVVGYIVRANGVVIAEPEGIDNTTLVLHNQKNNVPIVYEVTAIDSEGLESTPLYFTLS